MTINRRLDEIAQLQVGFAFKSAGFSSGNEDVRLLRGDNIGQGVLRWENAVRWSADDAVDERYAMQSGDLVIAMDRPWIGAGLKFASVTERDLPAWLVQRVARLRALPGVDQRYLHYLIASRDFTSHILAVQTGTAIPHVSGPQILSFGCPDHSLLEQRGIAEVLGALDDKIAANHNVLTGALDLAGALWRKCASTATESQSLRDVATLHYGKALPAGSRERGTVDVYGSGGVVGSHTQALVSGPGVVVGRKGTAGAVHWADGPHYPIDTTYWVEGKGSVGAHYLFFALRQAGLTEMNSDSAVPGLNRDEAYARPIPVPQSVDHDVFVGQCSALFDLVAQMKRESAALAGSRDSLLPLLMAGKVRVKDAEKAVEEVV